MRDERLTERAALLTTRGQSLLATRHEPGGNVIGPDRVDSPLFAEWRAGAVSFLKMVFGDDHPHFQSFQKHVSGATYTSALHGLGILKAAHEELAEGFVGRLEDVVAASIFTDFLEMAQHLVETGYKDAAASLCGAVLEDGLRRLAHARSVVVHQRDGLSAMNQALANASIYNRLVHQRLQAWIVLRNSADHGNFGEYSLADVEDMLSGVRRFLGDHL